MYSRYLMYPFPYIHINSMSIVVVCDDIPQASLHYALQMKTITSSLLTGDTSKIAELSANDRNSERDRKWDG